MKENQKVYVAGKYRRIGNKNGSLSIKLTTGKDWKTGKQIQHEYTGKTDREVVRKIECSLQYSDEELGLSTEDVTVSQIMEEWLAYKETGVSKGSWENVRSRIRSNILPYLGGCPVKELDVECLEDWILSLEEEMLSIRSIKLAVSLLKAALDLAVRNRRMVVNPCDDLRKIENVLSDQPILNEEQIRKLLVEEKEHPYALVYALMLGTGMRIGEVLGLSWRQVDLLRKELRVSQQLSRRSEEILPPKNRRSRVFPLPEWAVCTLDRAKAKQLQFMRESQNYNNAWNLVFTRPDGRPLNQAEVQRKFRELMEDTSNPGVSCHALRRTFASLGAEMGFLLGVQHVLGHADVGTTVRYVYPVESDAQQLVALMNVHFGPMVRTAMERMEG